MSQHLIEEALRKPSGPPERWINRKVGPAIRATIRAESAGVRIFALEPLAAHVERSYWIVR